jgi:hypothetical protein
MRWLLFIQPSTKTHWPHWERLICGVTDKCHFQQERHVFDSFHVLCVCGCECVVVCWLCERGNKRVREPEGTGALHPISPPNARAQLAGSRYRGRGAHRHQGAPLARAVKMGLRLLQTGELAPMLCWRWRVLFLACARKMR